MRFSGSSSSSDSFCMVDDDSVKSNPYSRCPLKLSLHDQKGFLHCRIIHLHQIADTDHHGRLSYPLLLDLLCKSNEFQTSRACIACTYKDQDDQDVLIASSDELEYAVRTQGTEDILKLHVKVQPQYQEEVKEKEETKDNSSNELLEKIAQHLTAMESRIHQKLDKSMSDLEGRLAEKLETMEKSIPAAEKNLVSAAKVDDHDDRQHNEALDHMEQGIASVRPFPTAVAEVATNVTTAECHWANPTTDGTATVEYRPNETWESGGLCNAQPPPTVACNGSMSNGVPNGLPLYVNGAPNTTKTGEESHIAYNTAADELTVDPEQRISNVLSSEVTPLLQKCLRRITYYEDKRMKGLSSIKEELKAQSSQMEGWNKTILDGMSVQTKVLRSRMNNRAERIVQRIAGVEGFLCDLSIKKILNKQWQAIRAVQAQQASLRNDIKTMLRAIAKETQTSEEESESESESSMSSASVYTSIPREVEVDHDETTCKTSGAQKETARFKSSDGNYMRGRNGRLISKLRLPMFHHEEKSSQTDNATNGDVNSVESKDETSSHTDSLILYGLVDDDKVKPVWSRKLIREKSETPGHVSDDDDENSRYDDDENSRYDDDENCRYDDDGGSKRWLV